MAIQVTYQPPALNPAVALTAAKEAAETAAAEALLKASQPLVPVDEGALVASGHVEHGPDGAAVIYSAVNPDDGYDYAGIQHEDLSFAHEHGEAQYLLKPMHSASTEMLLAIAEVERKALGG